MRVLQDDFPAGLFFCLRVWMGEMGGMGEIGADDSESSDNHESAHEHIADVNPFFRES